MSESSKVGRCVRAKTNNSTTASRSAPRWRAGAVVGDLNSRRAKIIDMGVQGKLKTVKCEVPLSEMFNYANALRSLSQGRASFSMEPAFYLPVPRNIQEKIVRAREEVKKEK